MQNFFTVIYNNNQSSAFLLEENQHKFEKLNYNDKFLLLQDISTLLIFNFVFLSTIGKKY